MNTDMIDWDLATRVATRLAPEGPNVGRELARDAVAQLRARASEAVRPVAECTGLGSDLVLAEADVVDRRAWIEGNIAGFQFVLAPVLDRMRHGGSPSGIAREVGSRVTAMQLGAALAWLSGKVLGQYEALVPVGRPSRLLLVAPNIVQVAHDLDLDQRDFQMWVCLHEETHRLQFTAVDWLPGYFAADVRSIVAALDVPVADYARRARAVLAAIAQLARGGEGLTGVVRAAMSDSQREVFDRLTALMTLLEGHADFVMDEIGPDVVPSVAKIREAFDWRRAHPNGFDAVVRRLLGMDAKLRQYSEGAAFVRATVEAVGMAGFNAVWASPEALPSLHEIARPQAWLRRVHG